MRVQMPAEYVHISRAHISLRTATSPTPADAISRFQIGFTTVQEGGFPNGLRCKRQILCIRVCHSAITKFPHLLCTERRAD